MRRLLKALKQPGRIIVYLGRRGFFKYLISDKLYIKLLFKQNLGYNLNLNNPQTFNEKLQWLKINDRQEIYKTLVDKYAVRQYLEKMFGAQYLFPLLGVWDKYEDIDFSLLPEKFVLKCTHDSGSVYIVDKKTQVNYEELGKKITKKLKKNYYWLGREWAYKDVPPRIIAEKYMQDESGGELADYKMLCFNGKVKCSFTCTERFSDDGLKVTFFDLDWNKMPFERHYPASDKKIEKPVNYQQMIRFAEQITKDMIFARVDFYELNGQLYIGEITLYPGDGLEEFTPQEYDKILGDMMVLIEK